MSEKYPKVIQVHMTEGQHEKLRQVAFSERVSMMECVRGLIEGLGGSGVPKAKPAEKVAPVVVSAPASVPVESVPMAKCKRCFDQFPVADMEADKKTGYLFCVDCVENMKNGQA